MPENGERLVVLEHHDYTFRERAQDAKNKGIKPEQSADELYISLTTNGGGVYPATDEFRDALRLTTGHYMDEKPVEVLEDREDLPGDDTHGFYRDPLCLACRACWRR